MVCLSRRKLPFCDELAAEFNTERVVHIEYVDRHPAYGCATHNTGTFQTEMVRPLMSAGMKEGGKFASVRVKPGKIGAFAAPQTGKRQIAQDCAATVLPGDDVFNFEGNCLCKECPGVARLRQQAVFASISGPLANRLFHLIHASPMQLGAV